MTDLHYRRWHNGAPRLYNGSARDQHKPAAGALPRVDRDLATQPTPSPHATDRDPIGRCPAGAAPQPVPVPRAEAARLKNGASLLPPEDGRGPRDQVGDRALGMQVHVAGASHCGNCKMR